MSWQAWTWTEWSKKWGSDNKTGTDSLEVCHRGDVSQTGAKTNTEMSTPERMNKDEGKGV